MSAKNFVSFMDTDTVEVFLGFTRVAQHRRSYKRYGHTTNIDHMPDAHKSYHEQRGWDKEYFMKQAAKIGPCTCQYIERMIDSKAIKEQAYRGCTGILRLTSSHPPASVEAACELALKSNSNTYRTIANILLNCDLLLTSQQPKPFKLPKHDNLRGSEAFS